MSVRAETDEVSAALAALCDAYAARALAAGGEVLPFYATHVVPRLAARAKGGDLAALLARARALAPAPLCDFLERAGEALPEVLTGERDASEAYLVEETTRFLYETSEVARRANAELAARVAARAPRRIVEVGAGTGGTTRAVLAALAAGAPSVDYLFTDTSTTLLARAARRLPGVRTARLDLERSPAAQGLATGEADVVLAANVLHATRDVDVALAHARELLAPGGALALWEATREEPWFDIGIALLPGWHRHEDGHREAGPLLSAAGWRARLDAAGLATEELVERDGQAIILARR